MVKKPALEGSNDASAATQPLADDTPKAASEEVWPEKDRDSWIQSLPADPSDEELAMIEEKIKEVYKDVFDTNLKTMKGAYCW